MFGIDQIISATTFIRHFRKVAKSLSENSAPLLIAQRNGRFLVVMDGEFFTGLINAHIWCGVTLSLDLVARNY
jgi:hypothetical protein